MIFGVSRRLCIGQNGARHGFDLPRSETLLATGRSTNFAAGFRIECRTTVLRNLVKLRGLNSQERILAVLTTGRSVATESKEPASRSRRVWRGLVQ